MLYVVISKFFTGPKSANLILTKFNLLTVEGEEDAFL